jgi:hypothetical protein
MARSIFAQRRVENGEKRLIYSSRFNIRETVSQQEGTTVTRIGVEQTTEGGNPCQRRGWGSSPTGNDPPRASRTFQLLCLPALLSAVASFQKNLMVPRCEGLFAFSELGRLEILMGNWGSYVATLSPDRWR